MAAIRGTSVDMSWSQANLDVARTAVVCWLLASANIRYAPECQDCTPGPCDKYLQECCKHCIMQKGVISLL